MVTKPDIAAAFREDRGGVALREMQRELKMGRDKICSDPTVINREGIAKAYDAGVSLLPELWRLEQRK